VKTRIVRISLWALIGSVVVCFWTLLMMTFPQFSIGQSLAIAVSIPASRLIPRTIPITYYEVALMNAATYALMGLAVEPFWRRQTSRSSN
jgi:hypothetical protein